MVTTRFTIDTVPPKFQSVLPADGTTLSQAAVTISGSVDDSRANVTLSDDAGGVSLANATFSFPVTLRPGLNDFILTARDPAGNEVVLPFRLIYQANTVRITNLVAGQIVEADNTLIVGTFEGPLNTGITVNGVVAQIVGNQFLVNVPLQSGENLLTVVMSTLDAEIGRYTLTITSTGTPPPFRVERVTESQATISTIAGIGDNGSSGDGGPASQAQLSAPISLLMSPDGGFYIADDSARRVRRVSTDGVISTIAGTGASGLGGDNGPATQATFLSVWSIAFGPDGSLYVVDGSAGIIRKISPDGIIDRFAGTGFFAYGGDNGLAINAHFRFPRGIAVGSDGSVYITDGNNNRVRRVTPDGIIRTIAGIGTAGYSGDGGLAAQARINRPHAIAVNGDGGVYFSELGRIRHISSSGIITTVAGTGVTGYSGDNGPAISAQIGTVYSLAIGSDGSLYLADASNNRIRRITPDGIIATLSGTGINGFEGDGGPAVQAKLDFPTGVAVDDRGGIYIGDLRNHRVRFVAPPSAASNTAPVVVGFRIVGPSDAPISTIEVDFDGDGTIDFITTNTEAVIRHLFENSGIYASKFFVRDAQGNVHELSYTVALNNVQQEEEIFRMLWGGMNDALAQGNTAAATSFLNESAKRKYQPVFEALKPHFPEIVASYSPLRRVSVSEEIAEYAVVRPNNGKNQLYLIYFLRDADGVWRVDGM